MTPATMRRVIVSGLVVLWEVLPQSGLVPALFLPPLTSVLAALWNDASDYAAALMVTLFEAAVGMVIACGGGLFAGALIGSLPGPRALLLPLVSSLYAVPLVILYPVLTVWLGIGPPSKIAFAAIYGFLPAMLGTAAGMRTIDPQFLIVARSMGATLPQRIIHVVLPAAIPTVLNALRLGGALVIVGVVVAEMLTSAAGIGFLISRYRTLLDSAHVFAGILAVLALAIGFDALLRSLERAVAGWRAGGGHAIAPETAPKEVACPT